MLTVVDPAHTDALVTFIRGMDVTLSGLDAPDVRL